MVGLCPSVVLKEKWLSLLCHIVKKHNWCIATKYTTSTHSNLSRRDWRVIAWLNNETSAYFALESVIRDKADDEKDQAHLAKFNLTGQLEVYHALYNKHCPKR